MILCKVLGIELRITLSASIVRNYIDVPLLKIYREIRAEPQLQLRGKHTKPSLFRFILFPRAWVEYLCVSQPSPGVCWQFVATKLVRDRESCGIASERLSVLCLTYYLFVPVLYRTISMALILLFRDCHAEVCF